MTHTSNREQLRILLMLNFFSEPYGSSLHPDYEKVFLSEVKIQKIDFLIHYPSYLCYERMRLHEENGDPAFGDLRSIIKIISDNQEPPLRTDEMRRFFYKAYEELDEPDWDSIKADYLTQAQTYLYPYN